MLAKPTEIPTIINLGCGRQKFEDTLNIDISPNVEPDWCHDVTQGLPEEWTDKIQGILALNFFVMIKETKEVLNECHRVIEPGRSMVMLNFDAGKFPHLYFQDPFHKKGFTRTTYDYFIEGTSHYRDFGSVYGFLPWGLVEIKEVGQCLRVTLTPIKS